MTILDAEKVAMPFGAHKDKTLAEIAAVDVTYIDYLLSVDLGDTWLTAAVRAIAEKHGRQAKRGSKATGGANQLPLF